MAQALAEEAVPPRIELIGHLQLYKLGLLQLSPRLPPQATINAWLPSPAAALHSRVTERETWDFLSRRCAVQVRELGQQWGSQLTPSIHLASPEEPDLAFPEVTLTSDRKPKMAT